MNYQALPHESGPQNDARDFVQLEGPQQELMQTENENRLLRHRLATTQDRTSGIEASLADVGNLLDIFSHQVLQQSEQIETLYHEVSSAHRQSLQCFTFECAWIATLQTFHKLRVRWRDFWEQQTFHVYIFRWRDLHYLLDADSHQQLLTRAEHLPG